MPNILVCYTYHQVALEGLSGEKIIQKSLKWLKKHPLFDGFLLPDRLLDLGYGLMGHRCDRWSNSYHTHSSGGGRGHIEASSA